MADVDPAVQVSINTCSVDGTMTLVQNFAGMVKTIDHLATNAGPSEEFGARILLSTANFLSMDTRSPDGEMTFAQSIKGVIETIERLAIDAAHAEQPCASILFSTANLMRVTVLETLH